MLLTQPLHKALREQPRRLAMVYGERRHSYAAFVDRVARIAGVLQTHGVHTGERVAVLAANSDRYLEILYGCWWAGAVVSPVNLRWSAEEVLYSLDDCAASVLLVDDAGLAVAQQVRARAASLKASFHFGDTAVEGWADFEALIAAAEPLADAMRQGDDLAAVLYTGGTTGRPKGVMLSHDNLAVGALATLVATPRPQPAVGLHVAPLFHVGGIAFAIQLLSRLATQVLIPAFSAEAVLQNVQTQRVTETFLVPTMLKLVVEYPQFRDYDTSSLGSVLYGAAPIDEALLDAAITRFPGAGFAQCYGMTEASPVVAALPAWCHQRQGHAAGKLMAAGVPVATAEIRIVDADARELAAGQAGEVVVRGPTVMQGYWNKPEQTAAALRDGWLHTGDVGYLDEDGFLFIVDRLKDMIVSGGENVYSAEVENAILKHPAVSACAVIGIPDARWGESVHAVVVLHDVAALDEARLVEHCRGLIAGYKCPRSVEFRPQLPLSAAGKLLKYALREPYWRDHRRGIA